MKIVYFIDHLRGDGTQRALKQIARGLAERGHTQTVVSMNDQSEDVIAAPLHAAGISIRVIGKKRWMTGSGYIETYRWLREQQFDVGVTLLYASDLIGRPLLRTARVARIISSLRARNVNYSSWMRVPTRLSMSLADRVVLNSWSVREFAILGEGVRADRIVVIPNGICVDEYIAPMPREMMARELDVPAGAPIITSIGRLTPQKGFDVLLRAFAALSDEDAHLVLIGQGEQESELRTLARGLDIGERVRFAGYRRDVPRLLGSFDVYAHPARFEGMPNAVMEAMAAGCPIVATAVDGTTELVTNAEAWLVPPDDVDALRDALQKALDDPMGARARGKRARARAVSHFSEQAMVDAWEQVLRG